MALTNIMAITKMTPMLNRRAKSPWRGAVALTAALGVLTPAGHVLCAAADGHLEIESASGGRCADSVDHDAHHDHHEASHEASHEAADEAMRFEHGHNHPHDDCAHCVDLPLEAPSRLTTAWDPSASRPLLILDTINLHVAEFAARSAQPALNPLRTVELPPLQGRAALSTIVFLC